MLGLPKLYKNDDIINKVLTKGSSGPVVPEPYFYLVTPFVLEGNKTITDGVTGVVTYGNYTVDYTNYKNYRWYAENPSSYTNKSISNASCFSTTTLEPGVYSLTATGTGPIIEGTSHSDVVKLKVTTTDATIREYKYYMDDGTIDNFTIYNSTNIQSVEPIVQANNTFSVDNIGFSLYKIGEPVMPSGTIIIKQSASFFFKKDSLSEGWLADNVEYLYAPSTGYNVHVSQWEVEDNMIKCTLYSATTTGFSVGTEVEPGHSNDTCIDFGVQAIYFVKNQTDWYNKTVSITDTVTGTEYFTSSWSSATNGYYANISSPTVISEVVGHVFTAKIVENLVTYVDGAIGLFGFDVNDTTRSWVQNAPTLMRTIKSNSGNYYTYMTIDASNWREDSGKVKFTTTAKPFPASSISPGFLMLPATDDPNPEGDIYITLPGLIKRTGYSNTEVNQYGSYDISSSYATGSLVYNSPSDYYFTKNNDNSIVFKFYGTNTSILPAGTYSLLKPGTTVPSGITGELRVCFLFATGGSSASMTINFTDGTTTNIIQNNEDRFLSGIEIENFPDNGQIIRNMGLTIYKIA